MCIFHFQTYSFLGVKDLHFPENLACRFATEGDVKAASARCCWAGFSHQISPNITKVGLMNKRDVGDVGLIDSNPEVQFGTKICQRLRSFPSFTMSFACLARLIGPAELTISWLGAKSHPPFIKKTPPFNETHGFFLSRISTSFWDHKDGVFRIFGGRDYSSNTWRYWADDWFRAEDISTTRRRQDVSMA